MAGVKSLIKQAQKMQQKMDAVQKELAEREIEISSGGGAVTITVTGSQEVKSLKLDAELLKEDKEIIEDVLLEAVREALAKAKAVNEEEMGKVTSGLALPGFPGM